LELLEKLKSTNAITIERICYSVSILVSVGILSNWETCIEDIIEFAKISKENCYLALIIMQNIMKELNELQIPGKKMLRIKDFLIEKLNIISDFVGLLLENFSINKDIIESNSFEARFFGQTLEFIHSWIKLDLNILKNQKILSTLFICFNAENSEKITDIFTESICLSKSGKIYYVQNEYDINLLYEKSDPLEIKSIEIISEFMNVFISENIIGNTILSDNQIKKLIGKNFNLKLKNNEKILILTNFANVYSSIFEYYPNLLFMKNELSSNLLNSLFYFLTHKNKKISSRIFMAFNEIKEFINRGYKLFNYSLEEKKEFCDFLIKICECIMTNCKVSDIYIPALAQGKLLNNIDDIEVSDPNDENNFSNEDILIAEYRKQAEEIFYDLFMIFLSNFEEEGVEYFFKFLNGILDASNINELQSSHSNNDKFFVIEVILLLINSIMTCFEVADSYSKFLVDFARKVIGSQIVQSEKLICPFLKFVDSACPYIHRDEILYNQTVKLFTEILKLKQFENLASLILLQITEFSKIPSKEIFDFLYNIYINQYDNFTNFTLGNFVEILANSIGVKDNLYDKIVKNDISERFVKYTSKEIFDHLKFVLAPATERIEKYFIVLAESLNNVGINIENLEFTHGINLNNLNEVNCGLNPILIENIKLQFFRNFHVYNLILKKAFFLSNEIMAQIFLEVMHKSGKLLDKIMRFFIKDVNFIKEISKIFNKLATNISLEILPYFDFINDLMLFLYINNPDNFYCLSVIKALYTNSAVNSSEKKEYIGNNFLELSEIIKKNIIEINKNNKLEIIVILCQLWTTVVNSVDTLKINDANLIYGFFDFILDVFKTVSEPELNKTILKLLSNLVTLSNIIPRELILNKFNDIIYAVFSSLDNLVGGCLTQVKFYCNLILLTFRYSYFLF